LDPVALLAALEDGGAAGEGAGYVGGEGRGGAELHGFGGDAGAIDEIGVDPKGDAVGRGDGGPGTFGVVGEKDFAGVGGGEDGGGGVGAGVDGGGSGGLKAGFGGGRKKGGGEGDNGGNGDGKEVFHDKGGS
jgi:hypothetical protein